MHEVSHEVRMVPLYGDVALQDETLVYGVPAGTFGRCVNVHYPPLG